MRFIARIRSFVRSDYRLPAAIVKSPSFNPASIYNLIADILIADTGSPDTAALLLQSVKAAGDGPVGDGFGCDVLRLDQLHPQLSGNKLFKLIGYLQDFAEQQTKLLFLDSECHVMCAITLAPPPTQSASTMRSPG